VGGARGLWGGGGWTYAGGGAEKSQGIGFPKEVGGSGSVGGGGGGGFVGPVGYSFRYHRGESGFWGDLAHGGGGVGWKEEWGGSGVKMSSAWKEESVGGALRGGGDTQVGIFHVQKEKKMDKGVGELGGLPLSRGRLD